ncbi:MAG: allophanate hydrolase [Candidatus Pelagibacter sp. TMED64]|nr:allophanate hydrolase [Candidatus Pelagibacter sp.]OUU67346.1 MAG: allophanate hydrolase [Candidatus Pelagibacter sp. TMED64]|tara:strand:- start:207 stop:893 length:687 start_codon:yes stop_codon:yes gene_type:complete
MFKKLNNIGDNGIVCDFGTEVSKEINTKVIELFQYLNKDKSLEKEVGILNCTPSYNKLIINFDLRKTNAAEVFKFLKAINYSKLNLSKKTTEWIIPVCYDFGLDFDRIEKKLKIDKDEIIDIHLKTNFFIYMIGFTPGHPFMGDLNSKLFLNRLETPRVKVPAGSVGIVEKFCNIYPHESPGGWNIIGKTPTKLFDNLNGKKPCLLSPGDTVKFKAITKNEFENFNNE